MASDVASNDSGQTQPSAENAPHGAEYLGVEMLRPGMQLNGVYEIDALLARGGMGEVYKGHSIQTGDLVAIKVIRADLAENEVAVALFRNEASKLHRLHHEAIIRYFLFSVDPVLQRTYLAMEFVAGEPLSHMVRRQPLDPETLRRLAQRIALGLHAAHKREIIHRDVSSDNIIVQNGDVDEAKIIDFGIARSTQAGTTFIDVGFAGKLNYVSPEQLGLCGGDVTAKSDIYSLGLVLLEALKGAPADMGGTQVEVIEKRKGLPDLSGVDGRILPILEKMLQPDPNDRPASMQAVADYFAELRFGPVSGRRPEPGRGTGQERAPTRQALSGRKQKAGFSPPLIASGLAGALLLVALGGGAYLWLAAPAKNPPSPPAVPLQPAPEKPLNEVESPSRPSSLDAPKPILTAKESIAQFLGQYAHAPCFSIISTEATNTSARIEGLGRSRDAFDALNAAFQETIGFEPDIRAILVPTTQCAALDFYNSAKANADAAPQLHVDAPFLRGTGPLTGSIVGAKDRRIEVLLIGDDGVARSPTSAAPGAPMRTFSIPVSPPKAEGQPQLLLLVASARPLSALQSVKATKAAQLLSAAAAEAVEKHEQLGVALSYFYVAQ